MKRLTTDTPNGNFETMMNFVYGKDGWAHIRHDGEHEDVKLTDWAKQQCLIRGCYVDAEDGPEDIDQRLCDCMMEGPTCPIAMAYCFASQAVHLRSRLKMYEDTMPLERAQELTQAEKDGRLVVLPCKVGDVVYEANKRGFVSHYKVISIHISECSVLIGWELIDGIYSNLNGFEVSALGKTVFLTREEAEAALKKREADNEVDSCGAFRGRD